MNWKYKHFGLRENFQRSYVVELSWVLKYIHIVNKYGFKISIICKDIYFIMSLVSFLINYYDCSGVLNLIYFVYPGLETIKITYMHRFSSLSLCMYVCLDFYIDDISRKDTDAKMFLFSSQRSAYILGLLSLEFLIKK